MLLASLSAVSGLRAVSNLCYQVLPAAKVSIYKFLAGRCSSPHSSSVTWNWSELEAVGNAMTFVVKFFQKDGSPYLVSDAGEITTEITHEGVMMARTLEFPGDTSLADMNKVTCGFTVHKAGEYKISVMVGGKHIQDSPFTKCFQAGPIEPSKTSFMHYTSTLVIPCRTSYPLVIEPRDSFGNLSAYRADRKEFFKIKVKEAGTTDWYFPTTQVIYSRVDKTLVMYIRLDKAGCYQALVFYGDRKLKNGEFDILVLNSAELNKVNRNLTKHKQNLWSEARLLKLNGQKLENPKKVYVHTSRKKITIKEVLFKIYPRKLCTFRVCPWTKFVYNGVNNLSGAPSFSIGDGSQTSVELATSDCNTIAATYSYFLLKRIGGSETFSDKRAFFYKQVRSIHHKRSHSSRMIKIDRSRLLHTSYKVTQHLHLSDWCQRFEIVFSGEQGLDWGGVCREWFEVLCKELFDPNCSHLFTRLTDNTQGLVHPRRSHDKSLRLYEFAGKIVGKCLFESAVGRTQLVKARFTRSFLAQLIGLKVTYKHFETDDPEYYATKISYIEKTSVDDMQLTFSEEVYDSQGKQIKVIDLIPNGSKISVTNSNKLLYLDSLAQHYLVTPVKNEVASFKRGMSSEIIPECLLNIFDEYELELLMCGTGTYSLADFKLHHVVVGASASFNKVLCWFWTIIESFTQEQMARLLQFTTGSSQLPPGGFSELSPKIQLLSVPTSNNLPSSHTCFNQLCLPDYDSMESFHKMLMLAITEGNQGFGMA